MAKKEKQYLHDILASKLGIRAISAFIYWLSSIKADTNTASLIVSMGLPRDDKNNDGLVNLLKIIAKQGEALQSKEKYGEGDKNSKP